MSEEWVNIHLAPSGKILRCLKEGGLREVLEGEGVEFPCGGKGICTGCAVRVISGLHPPSTHDRVQLGNEKVNHGWRLACRIQARADLELYVQGLGDTLPGVHMESMPGGEGFEGLGIAVDVGTTTMAALLIDGKSGAVLSQCACLNPQRVYGADIMSRVAAALKPDARMEMRDRVRTKIKALTDELTKPNGIDSRKIHRLVLVGNTVMHHLFYGLDLAPLSGFPFESPHLDWAEFDPKELGCDFGDSCESHFLPALGGFVGSDVLAGIYATGMLEDDRCNLLIDLGTNGEVVIGSRRGLLCASTAAGPAFEGATIEKGMRASAGAISRVWIENGNPRCQVIDSEMAVGICGSGLIDAVASGLDIGILLKSGRLILPDSIWPLTAGVYLSQRDIRQVQLGKGAIRCAIEILHESLKVRNPLEKVKHVYLAGAFGSDLNPRSACRIGLIDDRCGSVISVGNTALKGARMLLMNKDPLETCFQIKKAIRHINLNNHLDFQKRFVDELAFPDRNAVKEGIYQMTMNRGGSDNPTNSE